MLRTRGIFLAGCRRCTPAHFASLVSNPAGCTKLNIDLQEFMTFAGFLLYAAKYCKNTLIAGTSCLVNPDKKQLTLWVVQFVGDQRPLSAARHAAAARFFAVDFDAAADAYTGRTE